MTTTITSLSTEQFAKLRDWSINQMLPLLDNEHRGFTVDNRQWLSTKLACAIKLVDAHLPGDDWVKLVDETADAVIGYGIIGPYLRDPGVTEIMVNGPRQIYIERAGKLIESEVQYKNDTDLSRAIDNIVWPLGRKVDRSQPYVDARLPDGSRVNVIIPPCAVDGTGLTIRKFPSKRLTVSDLIQYGSLTQNTADFLQACVAARLNIVVVGGTGSGKTTLLNVISSFIPEDERICTIEDSAELQLSQRHVVRLETSPALPDGTGQVTIRDLVRNCLRMRPDRIVVGECRGGEALDMLQAMNTGHDGSLTTIHSNTPRDTLSRIETMVLMAGFDLPVRAIREQVASAVDLVVHVSRLKDGTRRVTHVTEVEGMEGDIITLQDLFLFDFGAGIDENTGKFLGRLKATGIRPTFSEHMQDMGIRLPADLFDPEPFAKRPDAFALR